MGDRDKQRIIIKNGGRDEAAPYLHQAQILMTQTKEQMRLSAYDLPEYSLRRDLPDGTVLQALSSYGNDIITVILNPKKEFTKEAAEEEENLEIGHLFLIGFNASTMMRINLPNMKISDIQPLISSGGLYDNGAENMGIDGRYVYSGGWDYPLTVHKIDTAKTPMQQVASTVLPHNWAPSKYTAVAHKKGKIFLNTGFDNVDGGSEVSLVKLDTKTMNVDKIQQLPDGNYGFDQEDWEIVVVDPEEQFIFTSASKRISGSPPNIFYRIVLLKYDINLNFISEVEVGSIGPYTPYTGARSAVIVGDYLYVGYANAILKINRHSMSITDILPITGVYPPSYSSIRIPTMFYHKGNKKIYIGTWEAPSTTIREIDVKTFSVSRSVHLPGYNTEGIYVFGAFVFALAFPLDHPVLFKIKLADFVTHSNLELTSYFPLGCWAMRGNTLTRNLG